MAVDVRKLIHTVQWTVALGSVAPRKAKATLLWRSWARLAASCRMEPWSCCLRKMTVWMLPVESSCFACSGYITDTLFGLKYLPGNLIFVNCEGI